MLEFSCPVKLVSPPSTTAPLSTPHLRQVVSPGPRHIPYGIAPDVRVRNVLGTVDDLLHHRILITQSGPLIYFVSDEHGFAWVGRSSALNRRMRSHLDKKTALGEALRRDSAHRQWAVTAATPAGLIPFIAENLRAILPPDYSRARDVIAALDRPATWANAVDIEFLCIALTNPFLNRLGRRFRWAADRDAATRALLDDFLRRVRDNEGTYGSSAGTPNS